MKITAEIRRLHGLMERNASIGGGITNVEIAEAYHIASTLPESRKRRCWVCWDEKKPAVVGSSLCRGHIGYALVTGK